MFVSRTAKENVRFETGLDREDMEEKGLSRGGLAAEKNSLDSNHGGQSFIVSFQVA